MFNIQFLKLLVECFHKKKNVLVHLQMSNQPVIKQALHLLNHAVLLGDRPPATAIAHKH